MATIMKSLRILPKDGWLTEEDFDKGEFDIEDAKAVMETLNEYYGFSFVFEGGLDTIRTGHKPGKEPEAIFKNEATGEKCVIEIKQFPYETNEVRADLLFKYSKLYKWFLEIHKEHSDADTRIVFEILIKNDNINPYRAIKDLKEIDPFVGFSNEHLEFRAVKWQRPNTYPLSSDREIQFDEYPDEFLVIENAKDRMTIKEAIADATNYNLYADLLFKEWQKKKWDLKFENYQNDKKFLYIKLIMGFGKGAALMERKFSLQVFGDAFLKKYRAEQSVSQLDGILFNADNHYQFVELKEGKPRWSKLNIVDHVPQFIAKS